MPIRIKETMPVVGKLKDENIFLMGMGRAEHQDIRQLQIAVVNIMPDKESAELQLLRLLSNSPLQTEVTFMRLKSHNYKNTAARYLREFYKTFDEIKDKYFDGLIITGAPVENLPFESVDYWGELSGIMEWSKKHVTSVMHICWAAQAGLYYHYGIEKYRLEKKLSGIYDHKLGAASELTRGFDDVFYAPHSRYTGVKKEDILSRAELEILADSDKAGAYIVIDKRRSLIFINGHPEYDAKTLDSEYKRDVKKGINPDIPVNYYPYDDPSKKPKASWRAHANLLFSNWLNYFVYQETPYDIESGRFDV